MNPLFSEIDTTDSALLAFQAERQKAQSYDGCLEAAIKAHVQKKGGDMHAPATRAEVAQLVAYGLIAQIEGLSMKIERLTQSEKNYKQLYEEKMDEVADLRAQLARRGGFP